MLQRQLYRSLLRQGIRFDRNPRLKALIFTNDVVFPASADEFLHGDGDDFVDNELNRLVRQNCTYGMFYKPQSSVAQLVREAFREPHFSLGGPQFIQLGFLALRRFFSCEAIAKHLTIVQKDAFFELTHGRDKLIRPVTSAELGSILVSHPLQSDRDLSNSLILITHIRKSSTSGISLNRQCGDFKSQLSRKECIQYGSFLKHFYTMPCFRGGAGRISKKRKINFAILHQQDSLASISERIELPGDSATRKGKTHLYLSYNFQAISRELVAGRINTSDLKIVQGRNDWTAEQMQEQVEENRFFPVSTSLTAQIAMQRPAPDGSGKDFNTDPEVWHSGSRSWYKMLHMMGGEYQDLARFKNFHDAKDADQYYNMLNSLPTGKDYIEGVTQNTRKAVGAKVARWW